MAAVSAPQTSTALTPPSSSHGPGGQTSWNYSVPAQQENARSKANDLSKSSNGHTLHHSSSRPEISQKRTDTFNSTRSTDSGHLAPARLNALTRKDSSISEGSAPDSLLDLYGPNRSGINSLDYSERKFATGDVVVDGEDPEHSRWIHRDKLARIESQELQAAGIVLPRARATSKSSRREHSRDQQINGLSSEQGQKRQRIEVPEEEESEEFHNWDLRLPEEVAGDQGDIYRDLNGKQGVSRIPVCKTSPAPIPLQHLERDTPIKWPQIGASTGEDQGLSYLKPKTPSQTLKTAEEANSTTTKRNFSENSPTKKSPAKKTSIRAASAPQRPKTKTGPNRDAPGQRPPTRSNERPEGDPPWLATMYKPDPRLPPDQQLLPTVAKRLQQEQWEKEGKYGNAYDTSFRPLNDEGVQPPESKPQTLEVPETPGEKDTEWPLRGPKSPTLSTGRPGTAGTGGYSTIPRISPHQGTPQGVGPLPSPRPPVRGQQPAEDNKKEGGCGCCLVM